MEKTTAEKIQELKTLRAELLAAAEQQDGESGDNNAAIAAMRKYYASNYLCEDNNDSSLSQTKEELVAQYEEPALDEQEHGKTLTLTRRR